MSKFQIKKVAVLGAGVMGAQIAAHLVNCQIPVVLFDLPAKEGPKNGTVTRAIENLKKLKPAPLGIAEDAALIQAANYEEHMAVLGECDLIIEAIAERMDYKLSLYTSIAPHVAPHAILASNTSGLSITALSQVLPQALQPRFCGVHFFNPPRYMALVELINTPTTQDGILDTLEAFLTTGLGKGVVRAYDTPNFIANRIGVVGMLTTMKQADNFGLSYDVVDDLTGKRLGRASSGTFRTADVVGLDTMAHVIATLQNNLNANSDPFYEQFATPKVLTHLMGLGHLGQKTGAGFYKKVGADIRRFDITAGDGGDYVAAGAKANEVVGRILKKPWSERLPLLRDAKGTEPRFVWSIIRDQLHYCAVHLAKVAETARDIDLAMRWGFGMAQGPFEIWQEAGWATVAKMIQDDIDAGLALCKAPLPAWVFEGPVAQAGGVHSAAGSWNATTLSFVPPRNLAVAQRQHFPERVMQSPSAAAKLAGTTVFEDEAIRVWTLDNEVLIASIQTKMHAISAGVTQGLLRAIDLAEKDYQGLVIWSADEMFSAGADLQEMLPAFMSMGVSAIDQAERHLQNTMLRLRYAHVPTISAVRGIALGGGCELAVYSAKRVAAMESYLGLVEVGVGLVPGAGGLTYIARCAADNAQHSTHKDLLPFLTDRFTAAAMAKVGTGAIDSRKLGYLLPSDIIVPHKDELLYVAIAQAKAMYQSGYRPPLKRSFAVAGRDGIATIKGSLVNMLEGGFISPHDFLITSKIAHVVCGGDVDAGTLVTEEYLMALEREAFCSLLVHPKTQERMMGMLSTGKPVRN